MARPKKATVDYFPHVTEHGKTIFIIEGKFGNDGYAVFFKILEQIGKSDGHYIDCNSKTTWEYLSAYCHVHVDLLREILNLCADLGAIDSAFWADGFIFSQNFVDGVKEAYRQRKIVIPDKASVSTVINSYKASVSTVINPQMKVNEMKVNETIKEESLSAGDFLDSSSLKNKTTPTPTENIFIKCFAQNEKRIRELYPHADYNAERETCIAHYRSGHPPIDCYPVILKWFQRVKKPLAMRAPDSHAAEVNRILSANAEACRQFAGEA